VGCCVVDDGYGVVNKLDIDEPPHGCNDSDHDGDHHDNHDGDDCDSNDELLSWVRVIRKEAAEHPPPTTTAASSSAFSSTTSTSTTVRLTAEHPPPTTTTTTASGAMPTTLTTVALSMPPAAATPTTLTIAESTILTPPVLRSATKKWLCQLCHLFRDKLGREQHPLLQKSPGQRPSRKRVASSTPMSPRKRVASSIPTLPRKRPARKENTNYSSLPIVSATIAVRRKSRGLPDHPSMKNDVLEGVPTTSGQAALLAEEVEAVIAEDECC
jgi:hypothetical protein